MKRSALFKKLFTTTLLSGCVLTHAQTASAATITYNAANSNSTILTDPITDQLKFSSTTNIQFQGKIDISSISGTGTTGSGIYISNTSTPIFNNDVNVSNGVYGIYNISSSSVFNSPVIINNNTTAGLTNNNGNVTFNSTFSASNSDIGFYGFTGSSVIFNDNVTLNNNTTAGLLHISNGNVTFNKDLFMSNNNIGIRNSSSNTPIYTFNGDVIFSSNTLDIGVWSANMQLIFNNDKIIDAYIFGNGSNSGKIIFNGAPTIKKPIGDISQSTYRINSVEFTLNNPAKRASLNKDIYAFTAIKFGGLTVGVDTSLTVKGPITVNNTIFDLTKDLTLDGVITDGTGNGVKISGPGKLIIIGNNAMNADIIPTLPNVSNVEFTGLPTLNKAIGANANNLASVRFSANSGTMTLNTNNIYTNSLYFGALTVSPSAAMTLNVPVNTADTTFNLTSYALNIAGNLTNVGSGVQVLGSKVLTFNGDNVINAILRPTTTGNGTVDFTDAPTITQPVGTSTYYFSLVKFSSNNPLKRVSLNNAIYANALTFGGLTVGVDTALTLTAPITINNTTFDLTKDLILSGTLTDSTGNGMRITGGAALKITGNNAINTDIISATPNNGNVEFTGLPTLNKSLGANGNNLASVKFSAVSGTVLLSKNIYTNTLSFAGLTVKPNAAGITFNAPIATAATVFDLSSYPLTIAGNLTNTGANVRIIGNNVLTFSGDNIINAALVPNSSGSITVDFTGLPVISQAIGSSTYKFNTVKLSLNDPTKRIALTKDIYANNFTLSGLTVGIDAPLLFNGSVTTNNTLFDLTKDLTILGTLTNNAVSGVEKVTIINSAVNNGALIFNSNNAITATIVPDSDGKGNILLSAAPTINNALGANGASLNTIKFTTATGTATLKNNIFAKSVEFGALTINVTSPATINAPVTTNTSKFTLSQNLTINGALIDNTNGGMTITGAGKLILAGNNAINTIITPTTTGNGNVEFTDGPTLNSPLGGSSLLFSSVTFSNNSSVTRASLKNNIYANLITFDKLTVGIDAPITLNAINVNNTTFDLMQDLTLTYSTSTNTTNNIILTDTSPGSLIYAANFYQLNSNILPQTSGHGTVKFPNGATVGGTLGILGKNLDTVSFPSVSGSGTVNKSIYANNIILGGLNFSAGASGVALQGNITTTNTVFNVGGNPLTINGNLTDNGSGIQISNGTSNYLIFAGDNIINALMRPVVTGQAMVDFTDAPTLVQAVGTPTYKFSMVKFSSIDPNKRVSLNNAIYANALTFGGLTIGADSPTILAVPVTTNNTQFDLVKDLTFSSTLTNTDTNGYITLKNTGLLTFAGNNIINAALMPATDGVDSNIVFSGGPTINKALGAANKRFNTINFSAGAGTTATLNNDIYAKAINFGALTVSVATPLTISAPVTTNTTAFTLPQNLTLSGALTDGSGGGITISGGGKLIIPGNVTLNTAITPPSVSNGNGNIEFTGAPTINKTLGANGNNLASVNFSAPAGKIITLNNPIYANNTILGGLTVQTGTAVTLNSPITTNSTVFDLPYDLTLNGALTDGTGNGITVSGAGTLKLAGNNTLNTAITPTTPNNGNIEFTGSPIINKNLGANGNNLAYVNFSAGAGSIAKINNPIYANNISFGGLTIQPGALITLNAPVSTKDTVFDLTNYALTIVGNFTNVGSGVQVIGSNILTFSGDNIINAILRPTLTGGSGTIEFTGAPTLVQTVGTASNPFALLKFSSNDPNKRVAINNNLYTNALQFGGLTIGVDSATICPVPITTTNTIFDLTKNLTITSTLTNIDANGSITLKNTGLLTFAGNNVINASLIPATDGLDSNIVFSGGPTINKALGAANKRFNTINFSAGAGTTATLNNDIYAKAINFGALTVSVATPLTISAPVTTNTTAFTLPQNLTLSGTLTDGSGGGITISGGGKLIIPGNVTLNTAITPPSVSNGNGNIEFTGAPTINKTLGANGNNLASVNFSAPAGKIITLNNPIYANNTILGGLTVQTGSAVTLNSPITTNSTVFDLPYDLTLNGALTDGTNGGITVSGAGKLKFAGNNALNTAITPTIPNNGNIEFTGSPIINKDLGASGNNLASINFSAGAGNLAKINNPIYANNISFGGLTIQPGALITFNAPVSTADTVLDLSTSALVINSSLTNTGSGIKLSGSNALTFTGDNIINAKIIPDTDGVNGNIEFTGGTTLNQDLGVSNFKFNTVKFSASSGKVATLNNNIYAKSLEFGSLTVKPNAVSMVFNAAITTTNTLFDLNNFPLTIDGNITDNGAAVTIDGSNKLTISGNSTIDAVLKPLNTGNGNIEFTGAPTLNEEIGSSSNNFNVVGFSAGSGTVILKENIYAKSLEFNSLTIKTGATANLGIPIIANNTVFDITDHPLTFSKSLTNIGNGAITIIGAKALKVRGNNVIDAKIVPDTDGVNGNIEFTDSPTVMKDLGTSTFAFNIVEFTAAAGNTAILNGNIYTKSLVFKGLTVNINSPMTLSAPVTATNTIFNLTKDLTITGALTNTDTNGSVTVKNTGTLKFVGNNVVDADIIPDTDGVNGSILFTDGPTVNGILGASNYKFNIVRFTGSGTVVTLNNDIYSNLIEFGDLTVKANSALTLSSSIKINTTMFDLSNNGITLNNFVTDNTGKGLSLLGPSPLTLAGSNAINFVVKPSSDNSINGNVIFTDNPTINTTLGTPSLNLASVNFANTNVATRASINNDIYAYETYFDKLTIGIDAPVTIALPVFTNNTTIDLADNLTIKHNFTNSDPNGAITLTGSGDLIFRFDNTIDATIIPDTDGIGNVRFTDAPVIEKSLGSLTYRLASVEFTETDINARTSLKSSVHAKTIELGALKIGIDNPITLDGDITINNTNLDLTNNGLTINNLVTDKTGNGLILTGSNPLTLSGSNAIDFIIKPSVDNGVNGKIIFTDNPTINTTLGTLSLNLASVDFTNSNSNMRVSLNDDIYAYTTSFDKLTVGIDAPVTIALPVFTNNTKIDLVKDLTINHNFTNSDPNGAITLTGNSKLIFKYDNIIDVAIVPVTGGTGNIEFTNAPTIYKSLGNSTSYLASVKFTEINNNVRSSLNDNIFAKTIELGALMIGIEKPLSLNGDITTNNTIFDLTKDLIISGALTNTDVNGNITLKNTGILTFSGNNVIDAKIVPDTDEVNGNIEFTDSPTLMRALGEPNYKFDVVQFTAGVGNVAVLNDNIYAKSIMFSGLSVKPNFAMTLSAPVMTNNTTFDLSSSSLTIANDITDISTNKEVTITGTKDLIFTGNSVVNAKLLPLVTDVNTVEFTDSPILNYDLGASLNRFNIVRLSAGNTATATLNKDIFAKYIELDALRVNINTPLTLNADITTNNTTLDLSSNGLTIAGNLTNLDINGAMVVKGEKTLIFDGDNIIDGAILPDTDGKGTLSFTGAPTLNYELGSSAKKFAAVRFINNDPLKRLSLDRNISTNDLSFDKLTVGIDTPLTLDSPITTNNTTFDLSSSALTIANNLSDISTNKEVTITGTKDLIFTGNSVINANLIPATNNVNNVEFTGTPTLNEELGSSSNNFNVVEFSASSGTVILKENIYAKSLEFNSLTIKTGATANLGIPVVANNTVFDITDHPLTFSKSLTNIGNGAITIIGAKALKVRGNNVIDAKIVPDTDGVNGNIEFTDSPTLMRALGEPNYKFDVVQFTAGLGNVAVLNDNIYAKSIMFSDLSVKPNFAMTLSAPITTNNTTFDLSSSALTIANDITDISTSKEVTITGTKDLIFTGNSVINAKLLPLINNVNTIEFTDSPTLNYDLGASLNRFNIVRLSAGNTATATLNKDIFAKYIELDALRVNINTPLTLNADITTNNTTLDLSSNGLTITGNLTNLDINGAMIVKGEKTLIFDGDNIIDGAILPDTDGKGTLSFTGAPTLNYELGSSAKKFAAVSFINNDPLKRLSLDRNISTNDLSFDKLTVGIDTPLTLDSPITTNNTTFDLTGNALTIANNLTDISTSKEVTITGTKDLIFTGNSVINANLIPTTNNVNNIEFTGSPTLNEELGSSSNNFNVVEFSASSGTVILKENIYAKSLEFNSLIIKTGATANLGIPVVANNTVFDITDHPLTFSKSLTNIGNGAITIIGAKALIFSGNNVIDAKIVPDTDEVNGNIQFTDSPTLMRALGEPNYKFDVVQFTAGVGNVAVLNDNIYAKSIMFSGLSVKPNFAMTLSAPVMTNNTTFDLSSSSLTIANDITDISTNKEVTITGTKDLIFTGNSVINAKLLPLISDVNTIEFTDSPTLNYDLGASLNRFNIVRLSAGNTATATLNKDIFAKYIELDALRVAINTPLTLNADITTNNTTLDLSSNGLTITGNLTNLDINGAMIVKGEKTLIFDGDNIIDGAILPDTDGKGTLSFTGAPTLNYELGSSAKKFAAVSFINNDPLKRLSLDRNISTNDLSFDKLTVGIDTPLTLDSPITTNNTTFDLSGNTLTITNNINDVSTNKEVIITGNNTLIFDGNNVINALLVPATTETSAIEFTGAPTINYAIGSPTKKFSLVEFSSNDPNTRIILRDNIYTKSSTIIFHKYIVAPDNNLLLNGTVSSENTTYDLIDKIVTIDGKLIHTDANGGITINTTYDGTNAGHFEFIGNSSVDLTNSANLTFNVTESPGLPLPTKGLERRIDMFVTNGGTLSFVPTNKVIINSSTNPSDKFVSWSFDPVDRALVQKLIVPPAVIIPVIVGGGGGGSTPIVKVPDTVTGNIPIVIQDPDLTDDLANEGVHNGQPALVDALERLESDVNTITQGEVGKNLAIDTTTLVKARGTNITSKDLAFNDETSGLSTGDEVDKFGAWFTPFFGQNMQKLRKTVPGYKSNYYGGVLGFDSAIGDRSILGIAFSTISTKIKHTDQNIGDKTTINTNIIYVYGTYELSNKWYIQNVTSIGQSQFKNHELRREFKKYSIASASFKTNFISTEFITGYEYKIQNNLRFTPSLGFNYNKSSDINYKESGTKKQNLIVKAKGLHQIGVIAGISFDGMYSLNNKIKLYPEIHGDIGYQLFTSKTDVDVRLVRLPQFKLVTKNVKPDKFLYNFGGSINSNINHKWVYSFGYDCKISDKFIAHQGTFKLRVNF